MRILIVSSYLPFPLYSGGHIRLYNLIKGLSKRHKITLICEKRFYQTQKDIDEVSKICEKVITVERQRQWSSKNILKAGFSTKPFLIAGHESSDMKRKIKEVLEEEKFDLIHVETSYVFQNLPKKVNIPVVLVEHNIEYLVYKRYAQGALFLAKPLLNVDILKLKKWEEGFWKKADAVVAVSEYERKIIGRVNTFIVPNGVSLESFPYVEPSKKFTQKFRKALFIGEFKWLQNRDSLEFILKEIWPKLNGKWHPLRPEARMANGKLLLWVVGKNIPESLKKLGGENVIFDENAPSKTSEIYRDSFILLSPIRVGGGTSFKILEAMASGVPVITTELGNGGILAKNGEGIIVSESETETVNNIRNLLEDEEMYSNLSKNGRKFIEENYSWEIIVKKLEKVYESVVI